MLFVLIWLIRKDVYKRQLLVEHGMGYALTIDKLINVTGDNNLCFVPLEPETTLNLSIIWKRYQMVSGASKEFVDRLKAVSYTHLDVYKRQG